MKNKICFPAAIAVATALVLFAAMPTSGKTKTVALPGGATMEFVWCEAGTFGMGSRSGLTLPPPELNCGDTLRRQCDADIQEILADAERSARETIVGHADEVERLAALLLARPILEKPKIDEFFGGHFG